MKFKSLLILVLAFVSLGVSAQTFTTDWQKPEGSYPWFATAADNLNTGAYNPITDKLYVAVRGAGIYIIDPATGAWTDSKMLSTVGIPIVGETGYDKFNYAKIATTTAGEIFMISLSTTGTPKIYYWADETANPELVSGDIIWQGERAGDSFAVTGTGDDAVIFVAGGPQAGVGGQFVQVFKKIGGTFKKYRYANLGVPAGRGPARSSISPVATGEDASFWISAPALAKSKNKYNGAVEDQILRRDPLVNGVPVPNHLSKEFAVVKYFEVGTEQFLAATGALSTVSTGEALALHIYNITDLANIVFVAGTTLTNTLQANTVPTADIDFKKTVNGDGTVTMQFFQIVNHNAFASHTITFLGTLPVSLTSFNASLVNNQSQLNWSTASELNNAGFEVQSSQDAVSFNKIGFVASKATNSSSKLDYSFQDKAAVAGTTYYRLKQLDLDGKFTYSDVKVVNNQFASAEVTVFPNPTTDFVEVGGLDMEGVSVDLFNSNGKKVNVLISGKKVSMASLPAGIYLLKVAKDGKVVKTTKVVKR